MKDRPRFRRVTVIVCCLAVFMLVAGVQVAQQPWGTGTTVNEAITALERLSLSQRVFMGKYDRTFFGDGWQTNNGCDTRNTILQRDLTNAAVSNACIVLNGTLNDPYTGNTISFVRGAATSSAVQIDHVVSLKDAWQKGAYSFDDQKRIALANDPLELIAVAGQANQQKSDGDAADWMPQYAPFKCQYVARQIAVKQKYGLSITTAEKQTIYNTLLQCPGQSLPKK